MNNMYKLFFVLGRVWSLTVNEPELIANGGGAQVALKNISSRFDLKNDDVEQLLVDKIYNGKFISGLLCKDGNLHLFSDRGEQMNEMFPLRKMVDTTIGNDHETKRPSTTINIGKLSKLFNYKNRYETYFLFFTLISVSLEVQK